MKLLFLLLTGAIASYTNSHTEYSLNAYAERMLTPLFTAKNTATRVSPIAYPNYSPYSSPSKSPSPRQGLQYPQGTVSGR